MKRKTYEKIKYVVISCIVALSLVISVNAPCFYQASVSERFGVFNGGNNFSVSCDPKSSNVVNGSMHYYKDYFAGGTVYYDYTVYDYFHLLGSMKTLNNYSAVNSFSTAFNFSVIEYARVNSIQFAFGSYEEFVNGNYHTFCALGSVFSFEKMQFDEINVVEYGSGEEIFFGVVFNCYAYSTPGTGNSYVGYIDFSLSGSVDFYGLDVVGATDLIYQTLDNMYSQNEDILADLESIYQSTENVSGKLSTLLTYIRTNNNTLSSINSSINNIVEDIESVLNYLSSINDSLGDVNDELDTQTSWLDKIWQSLQELLNLSSDKQQEQDNINNSVNGSLGNLGDLSNDLNFDKPDVGDINVNVNQYIPQGDIDNYSVLLKIFTEHSVVKDMLLISFTVCIVSYTLFGKKR